MFLVAKRKSVLRGASIGNKRPVDSSSERDCCQRHGACNISVLLLSMDRIVVRLRWLARGIVTLFGQVPPLRRKLLLGLLDTLDP